VASLSQGRTAAAQCGLFTYKSVPVIFEPPCTTIIFKIHYISFNSGSTLTMELLRIPETPTIRMHGCISRHHYNITSELV